MATAKSTARMKQKFDKEIAPALMKELGLGNPMAVPRLHNLVEARDGHGISQSQFLHQRGSDFLVEFLFHSGCRFRCCHVYFLSCSLLAYISVLMPVLAPLFL